MKEGLKYWKYLPFIWAKSASRSLMLALNYASSNHHHHHHHRQRHLVYYQASNISTLNSMTQVSLHTVITGFPMDGFLRYTGRHIGFHPQEMMHFHKLNGCHTQHFLFMFEKVDFNAGVVAAGEAQIESTVTGNDPRFVSSDKESALKDQSQGVQHIASRVDDLISFIQRCNDYRKMTGEGFTFLNIPRSYYGVLTEKQLVHGISSSTHPSDDTCEEDLNGSTAQGLSESCASSILIALEKSGVISSEGAVDLDLDASDMDDALEKHLIMDPSSSSDHVEEYRNKKQEVIDIILRSRYTNLYSLLRHHLSAESYVGIVKNQILVDVQGEDLLYQIFTCPILQRQSGEEAPFLEFIQRVCSECKDPNGCPAKMKPGCGGFGIRNFLTLFLSIEVSKAMLDVSRARSLLLVSSTDDGDKNQQSRTRRELQFAKEMVQLFTDQLNESNPILTELSDAMTQEGVARAALLLEITTSAMTSDDDSDYMTTAAAAARRQMWESHLKDAQDAKAMGHEKLMLCSSKYKTLMKELREQHDDDNMKHKA
eukprot:scaffold34042_cov53-Attheya_sp.AAC.2